MHHAFQEVDVENFGYVAGGPGPQVGFSIVAAVVIVVLVWTVVMTIRNRRRLQQIEAQLARAAAETESGEDPDAGGAPTR